jgi:uncharacterized membrane protein
LLACLVLGGFLRFHALDGQSLWNDELESWRQSNYPTLNQVLREGSIPDTHPPLFQITLYFVERYLGNSEPMLRLPSAIAGTLAIVAMFWLGRTTFGTPEGLITAFLTAVLWCPIYYSQEARNYSFLILFSILSGGFWLMLVQEIKQRTGPSFWLAAGYVLSALLAGYTHYYGLLLIVLQGAGLLLIAFLGKANRARAMMIYVVVLIGYLPWLPFAFVQISHFELISWIHPPGITFFPAYIAFLFNRLEVLGLIVLLAYTYLFASLIRRFIRRTPPHSAASLLASKEFLLGYWLVLPITIVYLVSIFRTPILTQRNLLISLPPAYLLLARAITALTNRPIRQLALAGMLGLLPLVHMVAVRGYYRYPDKEQFREAVEYVITHRDESRTEPVIGLAHYPDYFNYYFERYGSDSRVELLAGEEDDLPQVDSYLDQYQATRFWYISGHLAPTPDFLDALLEEYLLLDEKSFQQAHVWKFAIP